MTLTTLLAAVAQETGLDVTNDATKLTAWINSAYQFVSGSYAWPWLLKNGTIQTVTDITTGTVSINAGATSLTFSSAPAVSVANQYMIKFDDTSNDWYNISSHSAASTSATLASPYLGTSNLSGGSYTLRKVLYSLPSDCDRIIDLRQAITKVKLVPVDARTFDYYLPDPTATADPVYYSTIGLDSSNAWQVTLYPVPSETINIQVRYLKMITALSSGSDVPVIPAKFHDVLVFGALAMYGHEYIDDSRVTTAQTRFAAVLETMKREYNPAPDTMTVLQPWDLRPTYPTFRLRFPSNYPYPYGGY